MASRIVTLCTRSSIFTRFSSNSGLHSACMKGTILTLLCVLVGCGGSIKSVSPQTSVVRSGTVFVGDSIFGRWDLDSYFPGKGYVNGGWFGQRTDQILAVFPAILDGSRVCHGFDNIPGDPEFAFSCQSIKPPAEVVILLGWNDMFQDFNTTQAAANIKSMAQMAKAAGVHVVLVVPYRFDSAHPASWMQPFAACATDGSYPFSLNQEPLLNSGIIAEGLPTANLETVFLAGCQSDYTIDGVHPNASGYQQMHDAISPLL